MQTTLTPVMKVSECIEALNRHLDRLGEFIVEGEISRFDLRNGRLIFGSIKDATASIDVFSMTHLVKNFRQLEPGMLVQVLATPGLYKTSGKFRLMATRIEPQGEGALQLALEKLKSQLASEGLFNEERKRPLPEWPRQIGLITASGSSALADMLKILTARMGNLEIRVIPVNVQGKEAISTILKAFTYVKSNVTKFDLIIMGRGGGSLEDLKAFNSEEVCREVYACPVPVISAVGHEDNWSLTDYVADLRASTPSNAAELAVPDRRAVLNQVILLFNDIKTRLEKKLGMKRDEIYQAESTIKRGLKRMTQTVLSTMQKIPIMAVSLKQILETEKKQLMMVLPKIKVQLKGMRRLKEQDVLNLERLLKSLHYKNVLKRGYSITYLGQKVVRRADQVKPGDIITTQLMEGKINSIYKKENYD